MEDSFFEDDERPRFQLRRGAVAPSSVPSTPRSPVGKLHAVLCIATAAALFYFAFRLNSSFLAWFALSLTVGPFAPLSSTAGDIRVGVGPPLPDSSPSPSTDDADLRSNKRTPNHRRHKPEREPPVVIRNATFPAQDDVSLRLQKDSTKNADDKDEMEWTEEDYDTLKRQMAKHPAGEPQRWEKIAASYNGRHGVESVIRAAKSSPSGSGAAGSDAFKQFLKNRKPLDPRAEEAANAEAVASWTSGDDRALLNALKAFPVDAPMRWEKIAAAVPGKTKACCTKRFGELKRDFRSSKSATDLQKSKIT